MDDSKEISKQKYDEIKNKRILGIRRLKRPLKLPKLASQLLDFLGLNHRGVLCYLEGGEQVVIHRLQHNVTLTPITELNTSWEEEFGYDFCDPITLRQLWELAEVHEMYSYIWKNCIHTSNKILYFGAERGCCKDNRFSDINRMKTVDDKHTKQRSLHTLTLLEKRFLPRRIGPDADLSLLSIPLLERNCSCSENLFSTCTTEQFTKSPVCLKKHFHLTLNSDSHVSSLEDIINVDLITKCNTVLAVMSNRHGIQPVGIQIYWYGSRRADDINDWHKSFLNQIFSIGKELTNVTSTKNRTKKMVLTIIMSGAVVHCYIRIKDCHRSFRSKTDCAEYRLTITKVDRQILSDKDVQMYCPDLQMAQCLTKGQFCTAVLATCVGIRGNLGIEDISNFGRDIICSADERILPILANQTNIPLANRLLCTYYRSSLERTCFNTYRKDYTGIKYRLLENSLRLDNYTAIQVSFKPYVAVCNASSWDYLYTGYGNAIPAYISGHYVPQIGYSAQSCPGTSLWSCTIL